MAKKIMNKSVWIFVLLISGLSLPYQVYADEIALKQIEKKVVVKVNWGDGTGEIGEVPSRQEDHTVSGTGSINPIVLDSKGNIYVGDSINRRIQIYDGKGAFQKGINIESKIGFWKFKDLFIYKDRYIYALISSELIRLNIDGSVDSVFDLRSLGTLEEINGGEVKLDMRASFTGLNNRIFVDDAENTWLLGSDLVKLSDKFEILNRWGPDVNNFFIDKSGFVYVLSRSTEVRKYDKNFNLIKMSKQERKEKYVGSGWGFDDKIWWPEYSDAHWNVYGFSPVQPNNLIRYNLQEKQSLVYPFSIEDTIEESWTVDMKGNVYYTRSSGDRFEVIKMSVISK